MGGFFVFECINNKNTKFWRKILWAKKEKFDKIVDSLTIDDFLFSLQRVPYYIKANRFCEIEKILDKNKEKKVKFTYVMGFTDSEHYYNMLSDISVCKKLPYDEFYAFYDKFDEYDAIETTKYRMIVELANCDKFHMMKKLNHLDNYVFIISEVDLSPLIDFGNVLWKFTNKNEEIPEKYKEKALKEIKSFLKNNYFRNTRL